MCTWLRATPEGMMFTSRIFDKRLDTAIEKIQTENLQIVPHNPRLLDGWYVSRDPACLSEIFHAREVDGQRFFVGSLDQETMKPDGKVNGGSNE